MAQTRNSIGMRSGCPTTKKVNAGWQEAFVHTRESALALGFPYLIYAPVRAHVHASQNWSATTYPEAWQQVYASKKYLTRNPIRRHTLNSHRPFTWRQLEASLSGSDREIFEDCRHAGMVDGVVVPVHGPGGQAIAVGFACEYGDAINEEVLPLLQLMAHQLHQSQDSTELLPEIKLTPRELEVLQLLTEGVDNIQMADALKLSDNSVEWHLKNIFRKMDVRNRTAAAVKAVKLGLVYV